MVSKSTTRIDNIDGLLNALCEWGLGVGISLPTELEGLARHKKGPIKGHCHCSRCGSIQNHEINPKNWNNNWKTSKPNREFDIRRLEAITEPASPLSLSDQLENIVKPDSYYKNWYIDFIKSVCPLLFEYSCRNCDSVTFVIVYEGRSGLDMVMLPEQYGGIRTPNTNEHVAYYLDQAFRAKTIGARSAAACMYRAALEMLLYHEDYHQRMLGPKIEQLEKDRETGTAKAWAKNLDTEELKLLKKIADSAIHPNDGDTGKQRKIDDKLLIDLESILFMLLDSVYEEPIRIEERKKRLKGAEKKLK